MYFNFGRVRICSRCRTNLLVTTMSAFLARETSSAGAVRSKISHGPSAWRSSQLKSPGFSVYPSRTTIFISILDRRLPLAQPECLGDLSGFGQHEAGFADHGDELPAFVDATLGLRRVGNVDAGRDAPCFGVGQ